MNYVSNWQVTPQIHGPLWYERMRRKIEREVIEDAYLAGFTIKQIAGYFRMSQYRIYEKINVKELKQKAENL